MPEVEDEISEPGRSCESSEAKCQTLAADHKGTPCQDLQAEKSITVALAPLPLIINQQPHHSTLTYLQIKWFVVSKTPIERYSGVDDPVRGVNELSTRSKGPSLL